MTAHGARPVIPFSPLAAFVATRHERNDSNAGYRGVGRTEVWGRGSWQYRAFERGQVAGLLTVSMADRLACDLGCHPTFVWPTWYRLTSRLDDYEEEVSS